MLHHQTEPLPAISNEHPRQHQVQSRKIKIVSRLTWREYYGQFSPNNFFEFKEKERRFDYLERLTGDGDVFFFKKND